METQTEEVITAADIPALVERYHATLVRHAERKVPGQGEDIAQAAWVRAWVALQRGTRVESGRGALNWLYRIVTNLTIDWLRHEHYLSWLSLDALEIEPAHEGPEQVVQDQDESDRALAIFSARRRQAVMLRAAGYEPSDIAALFAVEPATIRVLLYNARKQAQEWREQQEKAG